MGPVADLAIIERQVKISWGELYETRREEVLKRVAKPERAIPLSAWDMGGAWREGPREGQGVLEG